MMTEQQLNEFADSVCDRTFGEAYEDYNLNSIQSTNVRLIDMAMFNCLRVIYPVWEIGEMKNDQFMGFIQLGDMFSK